jgi:hypothetical protein
MSKKLLAKNFAFQHLSPEGSEKDGSFGRSPDLPSFVSLPTPKGSGRGFDKTLVRLTVAGTATDLHRIPY